MSTAKTISMPVWQSALLARGCDLETGTGTLPLKLEPVGETLRATPVSSGYILPFNVHVRVGHAVTISWDRGLSRYIIESRGQKTAA